MHKDLNIKQSEIQKLHSQLNNIIGEIESLSWNKENPSILERNTLISAVEHINAAQTALVALTYALEEKTL